MDKQTTNQMLQEQAPVQPQMQPQMVPMMPTAIDNSEYFNNARNALLQECCLNQQQLAAYQVGGMFEFVVPLRTHGDDNLIGYVPGMRRLYKHIFLQNKQFKQQVVDYYRSMGFAWVDIVTLKRTQAVIFLWSKQQ